MADGGIILIEGLDATGKSTVANALAKARGSRTCILHAGPPRSSSITNEYVLPLVIARDGWTVICDRWHLGEPVWSRIFERDPIVDFSGLPRVENAIKALNVPVNALYLHRDVDEIRAELELREEKVVPLLHALELYEEAIKASDFWWMRTTLTEMSDGILPSHAG